MVDAFTTALAPRLGMRQLQGVLGKREIASDS